MDELTKRLRKLGYEVQEFNQWHHRVEDVFDFWTGRRGCKWHDRVTDERGKKPPDQLIPFIQLRLGKPGELKTEVPKQEFIRRLVEIGWSPEESEKAWKEKQSLLTS